MKAPWLLPALSLVLLMVIALAAISQLRPGFERFAGVTRPIELIPSLTGQPEYCLTCHQGIEEISAAHPIEVAGCVRCHGGNRLALTAEAAHESLLGGANPSDFSVVDQACGGSDCHSGSPEQARDHIARATTSLQATYAGAIAYVRRAFGAQPDGIARFGISNITVPQVTSPSGVASLQAFLPLPDGTPPPIEQFAERCLTCHLEAQPLPSPGYQRMTGCAACHAPTNYQGTYAGNDPTLDRRLPGQPALHRLTIAIPYTQCNACHNRGNYDLVSMTFHPRTDLPTDQRAPRIVDYYQPIAQFTRCEVELDCVDCHTSQEVMGDGNLHSAMSDVRYIQCQTCHGTLDSLPLAQTVSDANSLAMRRAFLDPKVVLNMGDKIIVTERGESLWNTRLNDDGSFSMVSKVSGMEYPIPLVQGSGCLQQSDQQESRYCHACHAVERELPN
jgi:hypothetical protein